MNNIEDYQNLVELLRYALVFYADINNYKVVEGGLNVMDFDGGSQARFALDKIKELEKTHADMKAEYIDAGNKSPEEITEMIKKLANGDH